VVTVHDGQLEVRELVHANLRKQAPTRHDEPQVDHRGQDRPLKAQVGREQPAEFAARRAGRGARSQATAALTQSVCLPLLCGTERIVSSMAQKEPARRVGHLFAEGV